MENTVEVTTDAEGHAVSSQFDEKYAGKEFKIKEKTAPEGYELDETEYTVTTWTRRKHLTRERYS